MRDTLLNRSNLLWFTPGLHVKRWFILMIAGIALIGLGVGFILIEIYREASLPAIFYYLTLQFIPRWARGLLLGSVGVGSFLFGLYKLNRTLIESVRGNDTQPIVKKLMRQRITSQGPRVVAIGGGHGLATLLRGLKQHTSNITAIVTVADDGGSSGRLRREFGMLPPGDFRMCISALADDESLVSQLMQYRFGGNSGLGGHSFGNLFITAMAELTGSFEKAILESSRVVASQGRIVPSTLTDVTLCAEYKALALAEWAAARSNAAPASPPMPARGESSIGKRGLPIERVWLEPDDPPAYPEAVKAILDAEVVVLGPGSLFTSVMPNLLVPGIVQAIREARARCIYVCNVATERGETEGFSMSDHVHALERHVGPNVVDAVLANDHVNPNFQAPHGVEIVLAESRVEGSAVAVLRADLADDAEPWRHDSRKLADAVMKFIKYDSANEFNDHNRDLGG